MSTREASFWGWGWADRFPDDATRKGFAASAQALLGFAPTALLAPPRLGDITLEAPRVNAPTTVRGIVQDTDEARVRHTYGRAYRDIVRGMRGDFRAAPDLVAFPRNEDDVVRVLDWATRERIAVVPYGGGTSVVGGVEAPREGAHRGVLSLDLRALDRVLEVDPVSRAAHIQAGALGPGLEAQLATHGLTLRHFPQSFEHSTLGGWLATRAGGHFATVYTHIDDLLESLRMITPAGTFETRRLPASGAGPSPDRLALGSEGALGVIVDAWMRVQARPRFRRSASVHFEQFGAAVEAARAIAQSHLYPTNCRLLDAREAMLNGVAQTNVLLLGFESADHAPDAHIARALALAESHGGTAPKGIVRRDEEDKKDAAASWKQAFIDAPYMQTMLVTLGVIADTFETACTWDKFAALDERVRHDVEAAMRRVAGTGTIWRRFTHVYADGPAPYYTFVAPAKPGGELEQWAEIKAAAADALLACGATITHHHAVGRMHEPWYAREVPPLFLKALGAVKQTLDPAGIMNPGVLLATR